MSEMRVGGAANLRPMDGIDHVLADFLEIGDGHFFKPLAATVEIFIDLDRRFLKHGMRFLAAADKQEILAAGEPGFPIVVVERHAQERSGFFRFVGGSHGCTSIR